MFGGAEENGASRYPGVGYGPVATPMLALSLEQERRDSRLKA
jgi:hypothetical protein